MKLKLKTIQFFLILVLLSNFAAAGEVLNCFQDPASCKQASTCLEDPKLCTEKNICTYATDYNSHTQKYVWSQYYPSHKTEALKRGISCKVQTTTIAIRNESSNKSIEKSYIQKCKISQQQAFLIQTKLKDLNLYSGPIDGLIGPISISAIKTAKRMLGSIATNGVCLEPSELKLIDKMIEQQQSLETNFASSTEKQAVNPILENCDTDPAYCSVIQLCQKSVKEVDGRKIWQSSKTSKKYVTSSKSLGLTCGVKDEFGRKEVASNCDQNPAKCTVSELCKKAVSFETGELSWSQDKAILPFVEYAKASGLTCAVPTTPLPIQTVQKNEMGIYPNRKALVIGNANYLNETPLENPINDARAIAEKLETVGFEVTYKEDLAYKDFGRAINDFEDNLEGSDISLFYFAGHGIEVDNQNFLIPVDAELKRAKDARYEAVMLEEVVSASLNTGKLSMVLIDACRDNPFIDRMKFGSRSIERGLRAIDIEPGSVNQIISFAAASGAVASDGEGRNSPYAQALVELIATPNLEVGRLFRLLGTRVSELTQGAQEPMRRDNLRGEDIFLVSTN